MQMDEAWRVLLGVAAGAVVGWLTAIPPEVVSELAWLNVLTALGTIGAVLAALYVAWRQRADQLAADVRAGKVAYWVVLPEAKQLMEVHFPTLESILRNIHALADGQSVPAREQAILARIVERMSMEGTKQVLDKIPLIESGAGIPVAEVYGRLPRLKGQLSGIAERIEGVDGIFREHVRLNLERVEKLRKALEQAGFSE